MKILHVLDHSLPLHSGYTFRSQSIFRAQRARGWQPVVVTAPKHEQNWKGEWAPREVIGDFTYYRTGRVEESEVPFLTEGRMMRALTQRILEVAAREKPDLIHAHSPVLNAMPALRAARKLGLPMVYEIRAFWEDAAVDHGSYAEGSCKYKLVRGLETRVCHRADQVAILCNGLKHDLVKRGIAEDKITPVFNGVNPDDFKPTPPDAEYFEKWRLKGKKVIGFIGSFYRYEGLDLLVRAFAEACREDKNTVLLLVGGGETEPELWQLVGELGLADRVVMPGRIPHERVPGVYSMLDVLVYPRYPMRLTDLVTPLKPLEAMAMGKVLVASDVGGHRELIRHGQNGILFPAGNVDALAQALRDVAGDTDLCDHIRREAPQWVIDHHRWQVTTAVYEDIYDKAMSSVNGRLSAVAEV
ncbi:PEP-CTERM/exosortase A-associated glycosyltransferase, Daro_2409 family [Geoalkalibacter ferrihydriticus]|uniref:Glycosyl transferase family 1 n=2 Tax=Geoalkalibacter ferrihydriticus TaxID=392333 RepID=A0A0C2HK20_9BACT|nr:TIGR04063 family PEP-CTERM/XrtA system glycosyltransferase [Geoalkalibacter ferrihydriticus]KIH75380.1 glycosyl transferase family 1 [Geoalkalibacter ferrihydriticus DSM 17813]SDM85205.1 PEP-CTERM/exosortase A-associated glycosyltransferase, Daro_2409 family [Geoalkalibacter ferrihydriticus]